jgi:triosephosphate isomerase
MNRTNRIPLIAGNWKMNGSRALVRALIGHLRQRLTENPQTAREVLVCPPAPYIAFVGELIQGAAIALGGQDCHNSQSGAHTGDISAQMLLDCGARYVILGHSERRADHGETSEMVAAKATAALDAGLRAIICVGETLAERDSGRAFSVVERQLQASLPGNFSRGAITIAYEPVWAIGTGRTASATDVQAMHLHIRKLITAWHQAGEEVRILYGGSVKPQNAGELLALGDVDGALVGGASLKAEDFWGIITAG